MIIFFYVQNLLFYYDSDQSGKPTGVIFLEVSSILSASTHYHSPQSRPIWSLMMIFYHLMNRNIVIRRSKESMYNEVLSTLEGVNLINN